MCFWQHSPMLHPVTPKPWLWVCSVYITLSASRDTVALILSVQCAHIALSASRDTEALILSVQCARITLSLLSHQAQPTNSAWNTSDQAIAYFSVFTTHTEISALLKHTGLIIKSKILLFSFHSCPAWKYQIIYLWIVLCLILKTVVWAAGLSCMKTQIKWFFGLGLGQNFCQFLLKWP